MNSDDSQPVARQRLGNTISLLMPAKSYRIQCSWTKQKALPAIEDFACRMLILFDEVRPTDLQEFFGLTSREREVLVETLIENRLVSLSSHGSLVPSPILSKQAREKGPEISLVEDEERSELATLELLTYSLVPRRTFDSSRFGLPEIEVNRHDKFGIDQVAHQFGRQYRAYLEYTRGNSQEVKEPLNNPHLI